MKNTIIPFFLGCAATVLVVFLFVIKPYKKSEMIEGMDVFGIAENVAKQRNATVRLVQKGTNNLPNGNGFTRHWRIQITASDNPVDPSERLHMIQDEIEDDIQGYVRSSFAHIEQFLGETGGDGREPFRYIYSTANVVGMLNGEHTLLDAHKSILRVYVHEHSK